jgi:hypothetical protein
MTSNGPVSKQTFYFSHDYGARNDPRLTKVLMKLGQAGKGVYWDLIEMLYEQGGKLMIEEIESYAFALRTDAGSINSLIKDFGLFNDDGQVFWSESVLKRLTIRSEKSQKAAESANKRWKKPGDNANAMQTHSEGNAIKENKGNKNKGKGFSPPSVDEVKKYFADNGYTEASAKRAFDHYSSGDWHDTNGNKVVNWKQKLRTNWFEDKNKIKVGKAGGFVE